MVYYKINKYKKLGSDIMKIEKLSENQIRCTLNKADLASRQLKISELAYGSDKAKDLFRDMMQQASYELGFEAEDIPLMIEAIPVSTDSIVLIITKVEDPEELDTRFSKFAPSISGDEDDTDAEDVYDETDYDFEYDDEDSLALSEEKKEEDPSGADDVISLFNKVKDYLNKTVDEPESSNTPDGSNFIPFNKSLKDSGKDRHDSPDSGTASSKTGTASTDSNDTSSSADDANVNVTRIFTFDRLNTVNNAAKIINHMYKGDSSLYKDNDSNIYYLIIRKSSATPAIFNKVCNILSEYGSKQHFTYASQSYIEEHYEKLIDGNAIQILGGL